MAVLWLVIGAVAGGGLGWLWGHANRRLASGQEDSPTPT